MTARTRKGLERDVAVGLHIIGRTHGGPAPSGVTTFPLCTLDPRWERVARVIESILSPALSCSQPRRSGRGLQRKGGRSPRQSPIKLN